MSQPTNGDATARGLGFDLCEVDETPRGVTSQQHSPETATSGGPAMTNRTHAGTATPGTGRLGFATEDSDLDFWWELCEGQGALRPIIMMDDSSPLETGRSKKSSSGEKECLRRTGLGLREDVNLVLQSGTTHAEIAAAIGYKSQSANNAGRDLESFMSGRSQDPEKKTNLFYSTYFAVDGTGGNGTPKFPAAPNQAGIPPTAGGPGGDDMNRAVTQESVATPPMGPTRSGSIEEVVEAPPRRAVVVPPLQLYKLATFPLLAKPQSGRSSVHSQSQSERSKWSGTPTTATKHEGQPVPSASLPPGVVSHPKNSGSPSCGVSVRLVDSRSDHTTSLVLFRNDTPSISESHFPPVFEPSASSGDPENPTVAVSASTSPSATTEQMTPSTSMDTPFVRQSSATAGGTTTTTGTTPGTTSSDLENTAQGLPQEAEPLTPSLRAFIFDQLTPRSIETLFALPDHLRADAVRALHRTVQEQARSQSNY